MSCTSSALQMPVPEETTEDHGRDDKSGAKTLARTLSDLYSATGQPETGDQLSKSIDELQKELLAHRLLSSDTEGHSSPSKKYFDSGDYALAKQAMLLGTVGTGHPRPETLIGGKNGRGGSRSASRLSQSPSLGALLEGGIDEKVDDPRAVTNNNQD